MSRSEHSEPRPGDREEAAMPHFPAPRQTDSAESKTQAKLMALDGVEGVGTTQDKLGEKAIVVYVRDAEAARGVPQTVDGLRVQVHVTGPINALPAK